MDRSVLEGVAFVQEKLLTVCGDKDAFMDKEFEAHLNVARGMFNDEHPGVEPEISLGAWTHSPARDAHVDDFGNEFPAKEVGVERHYQLRAPHV